jgi:hypothetical protein
MLREIRGYVVLCGPPGLFQPGFLTNNNPVAAGLSFQIGTGKFSSVMIKGGD